MPPEETRNIKSDFFMLQLSLRKDLAVLFLLVCGFFWFWFGFFLRAQPKTVISGNTGLSF